MTDITNKDSEQDVKIAVLDSTLDNATRRMELIHKRIRVTKTISKINRFHRDCFLYHSIISKIAMLFRMQVGKQK